MSRRDPFAGYLRGCGAHAGALDVLDGCAACRAIVKRIRWHATGEQQQIRERARPPQPSEAAPVALLLPLLKPA